jgi:hypothetical protein
MPGRSHLNLFNKDTRDFFILCIIFMCQLIVHYLLLLVVIYHCHSFILFVVRPSFVLCLTFVSLFIVQKKRFVSDPESCSRYFDPAVPVVQEYHHHRYKSINIIHQTAPTLS